MADAYELLEPETRGYDYEIAPHISIAISLKRIADALETIEVREERQEEAPPLPPAWACPKEGLPGHDMLTCPECVPF